MPPILPAHAPRRRDTNIGALHADVTTLIDAEPSVESMLVPIGAGLDVNGRTLSRRSERLAEAEAFVEDDEASEVVGVDVDCGVPEWGWCRLVHGRGLLSLQAALLRRPGFFAAVTAAWKACRTASAALGRSRMVRICSASSP
jgi:hypothetical protein